MKLSPKIWSTKAVEELIATINRTGVVPRYNPFHKGDLELREADLRWVNTPEEDAEYAKIMANPIYFAENFAKVMTDDGIQMVKLRRYQRRALVQLVKYQNNIWLASRQIGKSIITAIFIVHYILTNKDRNILILSRNGDKVEELMDKIEVIMKNLPMWLKPGTVTNQVMTKIYDNGVMVVAERTTANAGASVTAHLVYIDEFALIDAKFKDSFWRTVYPTMASSKIARMVLTSTPRGQEKFWSIYDGALKSKNSFHPMRTDWWEVDGRDEEWRLKQIADLGSEEDFNQEYGNQFLAGNKLLFKSDIMKRLNAMMIDFEYREIEELTDNEVDYEDSLCWHPLFDTEIARSEETRFVFSIDLADGMGGDYSVINMHQVLTMTKAEIDKLKIYSDEKDFFKLVQIGMFRSNQIPIEDVAKALYHLVCDIFIQDNVKIVLETNHEGKYFVSKVMEIEGDSNQIEADSLFVHFQKNIDTEELRLGLRQTEQTKDLNCKVIKDKVKYGQLVMVDSTTVQETASFAKDPKTGKYRGEGNDDIVMTEVNVTSYFSTMDYAEQCEDLMEFAPQGFRDAVAKKLGKLEARRDSEDDYIDLLV